MGARISALIGGSDVDPGARYVSDNLLTGRNAGFGGYLGFFDNQVSILKEASEYELFGWLNPGLRLDSASWTFLSRLVPGYQPVRGVRPFIASGIYENVLPMNVHPVHLIKSILTGDIEEMEGLGIYEITGEEIDLCEYIRRSMQCRRSCGRAST